MKINLLYNPLHWSNLVCSFLNPMYLEYFNIESFDETKNYDKSKYIIYTHWMNVDWANEWYDRGYKIVVDHLWDPWEHLDTIQTKPGYLVIRSNGWFCIANECLWYKSLGFDNYTSEPVNTKSFLMLINKPHVHRDQIWDSVQPYSSDAICSYRARGVALPDDIENNNPNWQRYFNPSWYNQTKYSLVVETNVEPPNPMVHSEKALKPFAFKHPMIVWGPPGYLQWLRTWGFQTFGHCIDESYDDIQNHQQRLEKIIQEVARLNATPKDYFEDNLTREILDHNYNRFYDVSWAQQQFQQQLINVIKEFAE